AGGHRVSDAEGALDAVRRRADSAASGRRLGGSKSCESRGVGLGVFPARTPTTGCMAQPTTYRFLSASPSSGASGMEYVPVVERPPGPRISREPLEQYPYLRELSLDWLDRYDESAVDEVDEFLRSHWEGIDRESAGHDLSVYLFNWVVVNVDAAYWVL